jgi:hypothetical protein
MENCMERLKRKKKDPEIPLLSIYPKELTSMCQRDVCTPMFIAALFIIAKIREQQKCPSMD